MTSATPSPAPDDVVFANLAEGALAAGRADLAGELVRLAATRSPRPAQPGEQLHAAGLQFLERGQFAEAETAFLAALRLRPDRANWHEHLAVALARQRRYAEAEATFRLAVRLDDSSRSVLRNLIQSCLDQRKWPAAEAAVTDALARDPESEDLHVQLAHIRCQAKNYAGAESVLREYLATHPDSVAAWHQLGVVQGESGDYTAAERSFHEEIRLAPQSAPAYANLTAALGKRELWAEAVAAGREATRLDPTYASAWSNLGNALRDLGRPDEAVPALQQAIRLAPGAAEAYGNLGLALAMLGRTPEALAWYERALQIQRDNAEVRFNRAVALLHQGDFERGWPEYEWRWRTEQMKPVRRQFPMPAWDGSSPDGKTILVHAEQGLGDSIQFLRFCAILAERGARVVVQVPEPLISLARTCPGVAEVLTPEGPVPAIDRHCPLLSLGHALHLRMQVIPGHVPYLTAPEDCVKKWQSHLAGVRGFKVGIVWQGSPGHIGDRWRSVNYERYAPLAAIPSVTLVSVQKGAGLEQLSKEAPVLELGSELGADLGDLAGLLMNLDLLIAVDTAPVHLAGALGRPVWVALPLNNDWRWLSERSDSPWYPSARLFRQQKFGDWDPVFQAIAEELRRIV